MPDSNIVLARKMVERVMAHGADVADVLVNDSTSLNVACRLGKLEDSERAESRDIGVRAIINQSQAFVSGSASDEDALARLAARVVDMARAAPPDPHCRLAPEERLAKTYPALDLADSHIPTADQLLAQALETEECARSKKGITNSEGAHASWGQSTTALATSHGFAAQETSTQFYLGCTVLAGADDTMQRDYAGHGTRHLEDLESPTTIGNRAAERTLARLHPRKVKTMKAPVVFSTRVSASLLRHLAAAISGLAVARGTSFLRDAMETQIMSPTLQVMDDPHRARGLASAGFDGEGIAPTPLQPIQDGRLTCWFLDCATAHQLGLESNGRAARGMGAPPAPAPTNFYIAPGTDSRDTLLANMGDGFYVTELIGMGVNGITGDYSRGASGFWVEGGAIAYPVSEVTIAGNLKTMFQQITAANDLTFRHSINAPTLLVEGMTLAGL